MNAATAQKVELHIRTELAKLNERVTALRGQPRRVFRARSRYIQEEMLRLEALARKWGIK